MEGAEMKMVRRSPLTAAASLSAKLSSEMSSQFFPLASNDGFDRSVVMDNFMITPRCRSFILLHMEKLFALFRAINRAINESRSKEGVLSHNAR